VTLNDRMQKLVWERIGNPPFKTASLPMDEDFCRRASLNPDPYEFAVYDEYDLVLAISAKEAELTQKSAKKTVVETLPMSFEAVPLNNSYKGSPVFVASANVFNFQGYLYLTGRVLPRFLHLYSDFHMEVIGDGCRYLRPTAGVQLWGFQPDLKPFYAQAPFAVCPLLAGTGQQIKIVEAMAHGVPVIAMKNIAESSPIIHGVNGFIAEDGQSFARWMQFCLENRGVCSELGRKARETIHAEYSEKGLQLKLEIILNRALERKSKSGERCVETEKKRSAAKSRSHQVLWIRTDSIGDNILSAAMLPHVKEKYPRAKITVLCQEHIKELYQPSPWVDSIVTFHRNRAYSDAVYRAELAARLGESHFDLTLNSVYSREALTDFFSIASKAKEIIGINGDLCNINSSERERNNRAYTCLVSSVNEMAPEIDRHREFLAALGINAPALRPVMWLTLDDEAYADRIFMQTGFDPAKTVGFFAGAQSKLRLYPNYGRALSQLCKDRGLQLIALGAASDYQINAAFLREIGGSSLNLSGKTSLRQAAAILKRCRLGVGAETGLAHMACAVAAPHVVLIGGGHFGRFMPYSPLTTVVCLPLDCFGCNWRCRHEVPHCIQGIDPGILVQALSDALDSGASAARIFVQSRVDWQTSAGRPLWQWPPPCKLPTDLQVQVTTCFNTVSREAKSVAADTQSTSKLTAHPLRNKLQKACPI
jgi:ADP-heptose:LPS heptosyltransferase